MEEKETKENKGPTNTTVAERSVRKRHYRVKRGVRAEKGTETGPMVVSAYNERKLSAALDSLVAQELQMARRGTTAPQEEYARFQAISNLVIRELVRRQSSVIDVFELRPLERR